MAWTQNEAILRYLKRYGVIEPAKAFYKLGVTKLSTRIGEIRRQGYKIKKEWKAVTTRNGRKTKVMAYRLA